MFTGRQLDFDASSNSQIDAPGFRISQKDLDGFIALGNNGFVKQVQEERQAIIESRRAHRNKIALKIYLLSMPIITILQLFALSVKFGLSSLSNNWAYIAAIPIEFIMCALMIWAGKKFIDYSEEEYIKQTWDAPLSEKNKETLKNISNYMLEHFNIDMYKEWQSLFQISESDFISEDLTESEIETEPLLLENEQRKELFDNKKEELFANSKETMHFFLCHLVKELKKKIPSADATECLDQENRQDEPHIPQTGIVTIFNIFSKNQSSPNVELSPV